MYNIINSIKSSVCSNKIISCVLAGLVVIGIGRLGQKIVAWVCNYKQMPKKPDVDKNPNLLDKIETVKNDSLIKDTPKTDLDMRVATVTPPPLYVYKCLVGKFESLSPESIQSGQEDPITCETLKNSSLVEDTKGCNYLASTVAQALIDNILSQSMGNNGGVLWETREQFENLLTYLISVTDGEQKQVLATIQETYQISLSILTELEKNFSFINLLNQIIERLKKETYDSSSALPTETQYQHLLFYYQIQDAFPEKIRKFLFPGHIFSNLDPICVASTKNICKQQTQRLAIFLDNNFNQTKITEIKNGVDYVVAFLNSRYPPFKPSVEQKSGVFSSLVDLCDISQKEIEITTPKTESHESNVAFTYSISQALLKGEGKKDFSLTLGLYVSELLNITAFSDSHSDIVELRKSYSHLPDFSLKIQEWVKGKLEKLESVPDSFIRAYRGQWRDWRQAKKYEPTIEIRSYSILKMVSKKHELTSLTTSYETCGDYEMEERNKLRVQIEQLISLTDAKNYIIDLFNTDPATCFPHIDEILGFGSSQILELNQAKDKPTTYSHQSIERVKLFYDKTTRDFGILKIN